MGVDELVGVWKKEELVQLVVKLFGGRLLANYAPCCPVCVDQVPNTVDVDGIPRVLIVPGLQLVPRSVVGAFRIPGDDLRVQTSIAGRKSSSIHPLSTEQKWPTERNTVNRPKVQRMGGNAGGNMHTVQVCTQTTNE